MRRLAPLAAALSLFAGVGCGAQSTAAAPEAAPPKSPASQGGGPLQVAAPSPETEPIERVAPAQLAAPGPYAIPQIQVNEAAPAGLALDPSRYATWSQQGRISIGKSHVDTAWLSGDERHLFVHSGAEATVRVYDAARRKLVGNHEVEGFSPGRFARGSILPWPGKAGAPSFLVVNETGISRYGGEDGERIAKFDTREHWDGRWTDDGRYLFATLSDTNSQSSIVHVFERSADEGLAELAQISSVHRIDEIAISHDNRMLAMVTYPADELVVAELGSGEIKWKAPLPEYTSTVDFSPDGLQVAVGGAQVMIFDVADPSRNASYAGLDNNAHRVRFSPSGDALAVGAYDGQARVLSTDLTDSKLQLLQSFKHARSANVYAVTWLADGSGLWTSSGDKTVRFWAGPKSKTPSKG